MNDTISPLDGVFQKGEEFGFEVPNAKLHTKYYYRACSKDGGGRTRYLYKMSQFDGPLIPSLPLYNFSSHSDFEIITHKAKMIFKDEAEISGEILSNDDLYRINDKFEFAFSDKPVECSYEKDLIEFDNRENNYFTKKVEDLEKGKRYYFRSCANYINGKSGDLQTFVAGGGEEIKNINPGGNLENKCKTDVEKNICSFDFTEKMEARDVFSKKVNSIIPGILTSYFSVKKETIDSYLKHQKEENNDNEVRVCPGDVCQIPSLGRDFCIEGGEQMEKKIQSYDFSFETYYGNPEVSNGEYTYILIHGIKSNPEA